MDHLAGFQEMVFPAGSVLLGANVRQKMGDAVASFPWRQSPSFLGMLKGHQTTVFALVGIVLLALMVARSMSGIALADLCQ